MSGFVFQIQQAVDCVIISLLNKVIIQTLKSQESPFIVEECGEMSGVFTSILTELADAMNFTIDLVYKEDAYGSYDQETNAWSGVMGRMIKHEADIGVAEFTMTGQRLDWVDFTLPLMLSRNRLYMRQPDGSAIQWSAYFRVNALQIHLEIRCKMSEKFN